MSRTRVIPYAVGLAARPCCAGLLPAGRIDWTTGWIFVAVLVWAFGLSALPPARVNPMIYRTRSRLRRGTRNGNLILVAIIPPAIVIEIPVATLDAGRMGRSDVPIRVVLIGYVLLIGAIAVTTWAQAILSD